MGAPTALLSVSEAELAAGELDGRYFPERMDAR